MADDFLKVKKGLNVKPQASPPSNAEDGDVFYEDSRGTHTVISSGQPMDLSSSATFTAVASMTSANFTAAVLRSNTIILTGGTAGTIHGMTAMPAGRMVNIVNATNQNIVIAHQSGTEGTAANRISTPNGINQTLNPGGSLPFVRDNTIGTWRAVFPTPPVVAKRSGVLTWNLNGVTSSFPVPFEFDGPRSVRRDVAITVYGVSVATDVPIVGGTSVDFVIERWDGAAWVFVALPSLSNATDLYSVTQTLSTNISANASGGTGGIRGIRFRCFIHNTTTGLTSSPRDFSVQLFWIEQ
jgi:hypothetical protein